MFPFGALFGLRLSMLVEVVLLGVLSVHGTTARIEEFRFSLFFLTGRLILTPYFFFFFFFWQIKLTASSKAPCASPTPQTASSYSSGTSTR